MGFPWTTILRWVLPTIPELISTVRKMKQPLAQGQSAQQDDLIGRIEKLEKALALESQLNDALLVQLQKRLQVLTFVAIFALVLSMIALGIVVFR